LQKIEVRVRGKGGAGVRMNASDQKKDKDEGSRTRMKTIQERKGRERDPVERGRQHLTGRRRCPG
jgi:hypothetical protein